ncbi:MAG TPA: hypothetical protein VK580_14375 [Steroidobacteraceae bacterium]|nr:hypothetical protein [Steroidobacteraceae bacterium]
MITTHAKRLALSTAILAACAAGGAPAKDTDVRNALAPCIDISSSADRLACYDKLAGRVSAPKALAASPAATSPSVASRAATSPEAAAPAPAASVAAAPAPAAAPTEEDFGRSKVRKAASSGAPPEIKSITAKVAAFGRSPNHRTQVTLDNGQIWEYQDDPDPLLSIGDSVTIKRATLGSFILLTPTKLSHRVSRVD